MEYPILDFVLVYNYPTEEPESPVTWYNSKQLSTLDYPTLGSLYGFLDTDLCEYYPRILENCNYTFNTRDFLYDSSQ